MFLNLEEKYIFFNIYDNNSMDDYGEEKNMRNRVK